jgi:hypothetical protein
MTVSARSVLRHAVVLVAGMLAGGRTASAVRSWQQWRLWRERDPSGAEAYRTFAEVDGVVAGISLILAVLIWWLLGPAEIRSED